MRNPFTRLENARSNTKGPGSDFDRERIIRSHKAARSLAEREAVGAPCCICRSTNPQRAPAHPCERDRNRNVSDTRREMRMSRASSAIDPASPPKGRSRLTRPPLTAAPPKQLGIIPSHKTYSTCFPSSSSSPHTSSRAEIPMPPGNSPQRGLARASRPPKRPFCLRPSSRFSQPSARSPGFGRVIARSTRCCGSAW